MNFNKNTIQQDGRGEGIALKDVPGLNGAYLISREGRVYHRRVQLRGKGNKARRVVKLRELQPCRGWDNRPTVTLYQDGRKVWSGAIDVLVRRVFPS